MAKILIADGHAVVRMGLRTLFEAVDGFQIVAEAGDGVAAVALERERRPNLVVIGVVLPKLNGIEATRSMVERNPRARVLAFAANGDGRIVARMLRAGALGYVLKRSHSDEIVRAARAVASGKPFLGSGLTERVVEAYMKKLEDDENPSLLTPREREVVQLLAEGRSTKETAGVLRISVKTAETHLSNIRDKLGLRTIADLTKYAVRTGITSIE